MARKQPHEDHVNHEAWAIPYGDLVTLLLAFFVVMYAVSSINEGKYRVAAASMSAAFGGTPKSPMPIQIGDHLAKGDGGDQKAPPLNAPAHRQEGREMLQRKPISQARPDVRPLAMTPDGPALRVQAEAAVDPTLQAIGDEIIQALAPLLADDMVRIVHRHSWLEVEINTDLLFASGSADLAHDVLPVMDEIGRILAGFDNRVRVEGHTDDRPISTRVFPSNWELSAARAGTVVRRLRDQSVLPGRLSVVGYGEFRPLGVNDTPEGRRQNRRVTLIVLAAEHTEVADAPASNDTPES
ncbi:flagellar motor protein MotD [Polycyclovorans algicola]|uniref:flagellar motor protein MotD n=1 Tax=Polycyclovorans algicola TaxID=616992 RepID=UPI000693F1E6|nr:flagellar motor protein MotD [Polycyclovorans algicola]